MFSRVRPLVGKFGRGIQGCWQVLVVAGRHLGDQFSDDRRGPSTHQEVVALTRAIGDADVVSFDLYDTLMARSIHDPELVHTAVRLVAAERGVDVPTDWEKLRRRAEAAARASSTRADITHTDIYDRLHLAPETQIALLELELELEESLLQRTRRGSALYAAAVHAGKRVVVTSDMYLPKALLSGSLSRGGYDEQERLIASGEDGIAKQDGSTFVHLAQEFPEQRVLHIGDDRIKDVLRAQGSGVDGRLLQRPLIAQGRRWAGSGPHRLRRQSAVEGLQISVMRSLAEAHLDRVGPDGPHGDVKAIGYNVLGPLLVGFSTYLDHEARERGADHLVFLAREGAVLQRAYDALAGESALPSRYGVLSSRILGLANLGTGFSTEDVRFLTKSSIALTPEQFVRRIIPQVDENRLTEALVRVGLPPDQRVHGGRAETVLPSLFSALSEDLREPVETTRVPLAQYLRSLELEDPRTLVVDSGWVGTLQHAIGEMLGVTVGGIYVGVHDTPASRRRPSMSGWVDGRRGGEQLTLQRSLYAHVQPLEVLLANTSVGSVVGIRADSSAPEGFTFDYLPSEFGAEAVEAVTQLQLAALEFVEDWKEAVRGLGEVAGALALRPAVAPTLQLMTRPTLTQYRALGRLPFDGTYGVRPTVLGRWWVPDQFRRHI